MIKAFGMDFIEVKNENISINITTFETGKKFYSVRIEDGEKLKIKECKTLNECLDYLKLNIL